MSRLLKIEPILCTVAAAATMLRVTHVEILNLCDSGDLRFIGKGSGRRIHISSIKACEAKVAERQYREDLGGYVYVIEWHGYYKIGKARDVSQRLRDIGCSHPVPPKLYKVIPTNAMGQLESRLHKRLAHKRVSGEWFNLDENDLQYLRSQGPYVLGRKVDRNYDDEEDVSDDVAPCIDS